MAQNLTHWALWPCTYPEPEDSSSWTPFLPQDTSHPLEGLAVPGQGVWGKHGRFLSGEEWHNESSVSGRGRWAGLRGRSRTRRVRGNECASCPPCASHWTRRTAPGNSGWFTFPQKASCLSLMLFGNSRSPVPLKRRKQTDLTKPTTWQIHMEWGITSESGPSLYSTF